jgi:DNA-binding response OmpR family regulator
MEIRILLVEDNPADVFLIEEALRTHALRFNLKWISDAEEALALFRDPSLTGGAAPHLILLDLNLPRVDGKELLARIRSTPALTGTRVAVLTSSDSPADRRDVEALGADCYINKPSTLDEFLAIGGVVKELVSGVCG